MSLVICTFALLLLCCIQVSCDQTMTFSASGKKLSVAGKRPANAVLSKSQTLPRSMGSRTTPVQPVRPFNKVSSTPPAVKKQLSMPGAGSPARRVNNNGGIYICI